MAGKTKGRVVTLGPERRPFNCLACGYVQMFVDGMAELWDPPG
jgi:hypothetical protein